MRNFCGQVQMGICLKIFAWNIGIMMIIPMMMFAQAPASNDTLEIRSGASSVPVPPKKSDVETQASSRADTLSRPKSLPAPTPEEVLQISLEKLLELPIERVLEYARVLDSLQAAQQSTPNRHRSHKKSSSATKSSTAKTNPPSALDKLNAALQQIQSGKAASKPSSGGTSQRLSREEILRMKLKDLMDMRLGEILRLVNPVLVSSATSGVQKK
jgi:hypothetical protein